MGGLNSRARRRPAAFLQRTVRLTLAAQRSHGAMGEGEEAERHGSEMTVQPTPSWPLATEHATGRYNMLLLVTWSTSEAYGPGDILEAYSGWGIMHASLVVERMAKTRALSGAGRELEGWFCNVVKEA